LIVTYALDSLTIPLARAPKERCVARFQEFIEGDVWHDRRSEEDGVLHRCGLDVDRRKHKEGEKTCVLINQLN